MAESRATVLVKEKIADAGVDLLKEHFDVEIGVEWSDDELAEKIGSFDGIVIRSATQLTEDLIEKADKLKVIGRAGVGVDNVDVAAATKRGIIVANAPQSNVVTAAEHTMALLLSMARNVPQAHGSLTSGKWERSKFGGVELYEKTLGILGLGRIGQLVAQRARGFDMKVVAYDPFVSSERFREMGIEKAESPGDLFKVADFITIHLPNTEETKGFLNAEAFAQMKDGVRVINCARGGLVDDAALQAAIDSGKVVGAALDVFPDEPITDYPLFEGYENVVVTPHLGASTTEAQDRAGVQTAEQVVAALTDGAVTTAVNIPSVKPEDMELLNPLLPLCEALGRIAVGLAPASVDRVELEFRGRLAEFDTRLLTIATLNGFLKGHTEEQVNYVNAASIAEERGIRVSETKDSSVGDFAELVRVSIVGAGKTVTTAGTTFGPKRIPHLVEAWGQQFNLELEPNIAFFRYKDQPGMIGRVGDHFGKQGVNISSASVGRSIDGGDPTPGGEAVMIVTAESPVTQKLVDELVTSGDFFEGRAVTL